MLLCVASIFLSFIFADLSNEVRKMLKLFCKLACSKLKPIASRVPKTQESDQNFQYCPVRSESSSVHCRCCMGPKAAAYHLKVQIWAVNRLSHDYCPCFRGIESFAEYTVVDECTGSLHVRLFRRQARFG